MKILVIGEINPDLILMNYSQFPVLGREVLVEGTSLTLGSSSAICAAGLARLGNHVAMLGKIGCDPWGKFCADRLLALGVDTSLVLRDSNVSTGITVSISSPSDRALITYPGAIELLSLRDIDPALLRGFRHLHVSSYFIQHALRPGCRELFELAHDSGMTTSLDPGYDPAETWDGGIRTALEETDVFLPSEVELEGITGRKDPVEGLRALANGHTLTVVKLGAQGCMTLDNGEPLHVPARPIQPVDTTGAGDSFNAGFLHAWLNNEPLDAALRLGSACGTLSTQGPGGTGAQATEQQAREFASTGVST